MTEIEARLSNARPRRIEERTTLEGEVVLIFTWGVEAVSAAGST